MESAQHGSDELVGVVKFFNFERDFGFISPKSGGPDIFFHLNGVHSGLMQSGLRVTYTLVTTLVRGFWKLQAEHVTGAPIPRSQQLSDREQCMAARSWLWYKQCYVPSFYRGHHGVFSQPCMPATCVDASSHDPVVCPGSVNASATLFSTLLDPEDDWMEVEIASDGEFFAASAAPSV